MLKLVWNNILFSIRNLAEVMPVLPVSCVRGPVLQLYSVYDQAF